MTSHRDAPPDRAEPTPARTETRGQPKKLQRGVADAKHPSRKGQGIVLDDKDQEQPADKSRAQKSGHS
jgi:hypothetical protein